MDRQFRRSRTSKGNETYGFFPLWKPHSSLGVRLPLVGSEPSSVSAERKTFPLTEGGVLIEERRDKRRENQWYASLRFHCVSVFRDRNYLAEALTSCTGPIRPEGSKGESAR